MPILGKVAYARGVEPFALLSWRFVVAAAVLWIILILQTRRTATRVLPSTSISGTLLALGGFLLTFEVALYFLGLQFISVGLAEVLLFLFPAWVVLITGVVHRKMPSALTVGCAALAVLGAGLTVGSYALAEDATGQAIWGVLLLLGASVAYAVYVVLNAKVVTRAGSLRATTLIITGAAVSFSAVAWTTGSRGPSDGPGYWAALGMAVLSTVAAFGLLSAGLTYLSASHASVVATLEPVLAVALGWSVLGETVGAIQLGGMAVVLVAVGLILWRSGQSGDAEFS